MENRQDRDRERKHQQSGNPSKQGDVGAPGSQKPEDIQSGSDRSLPTDRGSEKPIPGRSGLMDEKKKRSDIDSPSR